MKKNNLLKTTFLITIIVTCTHCASTYKFSPDPPEVKDLTDKELNSLVLSFEYFEDIRREDPANEIYFKESRTTHLSNENNSKKCINSEKNYGSDLIQILTKLTAYHLKNEQVFKNVVYGKKHLADYYITAKLKNFRVLQDYETSKAIRKEVPSTGYGCYGTYVSIIEYYSNAEVLMQYAEVKLHSKDGTLIKEIDLITNHEVSEFLVDRKCWCAFRTAEDSLLKMNKQLANEIIPIIEAIEQNKRKIVSLDN